jgi:pimeloyl-ACP methyl ester carboxylesterase
MDNLAYRGSVADGGVGQPVKTSVPGQFDVQVIERRMPDGTIQRSYIVDIPGTRDFNLPGQLNSDLNDQGTNVRAMAGEQTGYERAIDQALAQVGAGPNDRVMLVGHSQGGMVAMRAANDFVTSGKYNVTNVVTAGSPVADMPVPSKVQVLFLENSYDLVPHLGPHDNPDLPNRTTATIDQQMVTTDPSTSLMDNHSVTAVYGPAAHRLDSSSDPSVRAFRDSAAPFIGGDNSTTHPFQVSRGGL